MVEEKLETLARIKEHRNLTRRVHLSWTPGERLQDAYLVYVTPTRYVRPNSDAPRSWGREHLFLGYRVWEMCLVQILQSRFRDLRQLHALDWNQQ